MNTVLITGGTGLIGKALSKALLEKGYHVIVLTRQIPAHDSQRISTNEKSLPLVEYALWNVKQQSIDSNAIMKADFIVHLAGAGVADRRWTKKRKEEIVHSRTDSSKLIVSSLVDIPDNIKAVVSASAIGWYGPDPGTPGNSIFTENDNAATDFLGQACKQWEQSIEAVKEQGKRLVKLRTGIVLAKKGGAIKEFLKPLQFGIAAILGNGKQMISWIHIDDLVKIYMNAIEDDNIAGVYNAVAPHPVSNKKLVSQLAKSRKKFFIPLYVPSFFLKAILGEMSTEVLKSATVSADKIQQTGFQFAYPTIEDAMKELAT